MKKLLLKELRLALHPICVIFLCMSAMLLIPSYPYYVAFFYTTLGIFFVCMTARENQDIAYSLLLPVRRCDLVRARILMCVLLELLQLVLSIPFAAVSQAINLMPNFVGMEPNIAFFGCTMVMFGLFNVVFFPMYYRAPSKVGVPFIIGSAVEAVFIVLAEFATHFVPYVRRVIDTRDTVYIPQKLIVLALGVVLFAGLTLAACRISEKRFERIDL